MMMFIRRWLFIVLFLTVNSHFLFPQCNESIFHSSEMNEKAFKSWEIKNQNVLQQFYRGHGTSDEIAEADLSRRISVNIKSKLIAKFREENLEVIENSLNDYLESETESILLNTKKIIVKHVADSSPTIHLYKCKKEYIEEQRIHNNVLKEQAKNHFNDYENKYDKRDYTHAFYPLCKAFLFASSIIDTFDLSVKIEDKLIEFLDNINIDTDKPKIYDIIPGVRSDNRPTITAYFLNNVLKHFILNAQFIKGSNDWENNEKLVDLGSTGKKQLNIGIIRSHTKVQEIILYPDLTRLFTDPFIVKNIKQNAQDRLDKLIRQKFMTDPQIKIEIREKFQVELMDINCVDCTVAEKSVIHQKAVSAINNSGIFEKADKPDYDLSIKVIKGNNRSSYRMSAGLSLRNGENIARYEDNNYKQIKSFNFEKLFKNLKKNSFSSFITARNINNNNEVELIKNGEKIELLSKSKKKTRIENGKVNLLFKYNNMIYKDTTLYISGDIDISDWFIENNNSVGYKTKNIKYYYDIANPNNRNGLMIFWNNRNPEVYSNLNNGFKTLNILEGKSDKKQILKFKKDGWYSYKNIIKPNLLNPSNSITVNMKKVDFNTLNSFKFYTVPGSAQYHLYQTKTWRKWQAGAYLVLVSYFVWDGYKSYQTYSSSFQEYDNYKLKYESLENQEDDELYNNYYDKAQSAHIKMTRAFNDFQINMGGITLIYTINLVEVIQGWMKFRK